MRLISELLSGKQNTKRINNSGQGKLPCPAFLYIENHSLGEWFKKGCCR